MKNLSTCRIISIVENLTERINNIAIEAEYIREVILRDLSEEESTIKTYCSKDYKEVKKELQKGLIWAKRGSKIRNKYFYTINFSNFDERVDRFGVEYDFFNL